MKLSLNWLQDYVDLQGIAPEDIATELTLKTCEVESHSVTFSHLTQIQIAQVLKKDKHPHADRLSVCLVESLGKKLQIVCGAPNVAAGQFVALAVEGTRLPGDPPCIIKKATIRNVESSGMICSKAELGLQDFPFLEKDGSGILILPEEASRSGKVFTDWLPLHDVIFEIDNKSITHRPDLWGHSGFARELSAIFSRKLMYDPGKTRAQRAHSDLPGKAIQINKGCAHAYYGQYVENIQILPSPLFMQARLFLTGQRPINNVVDASNYVMAELAQPNHAFDYKNLKGDKICVMRAGNAGVEEITLLDESQLKVDPESILIMDDTTAVALAGIMGGKDSSIQPDTRALFLESATFPRESIRKTLQLCGLRTESAIRFEKGQNTENALPALRRLLELLKLTCPALKSGPVSGSHTPAPKNAIKTSGAFINNRLGTNLKPKDIKKILEPAGFQVRLAEKGDALQIQSPSWRSWYDISIAEDIVEEVGRLTGYNNIVPQAPAVPCLPSSGNSDRRLERKLKEYLAARCFFETMNYSFCSPRDNGLRQEPAVNLSNPVHQEQSQLRTTLFPGMLRQLKHNQDLMREIRLFEAGRIYLDRKDSLPDERLIFSIAVMPEKKLAADAAAMETRFIEFRRLLEELLRTFRAFYGLEARRIPGLHPSCSVAFQSASQIVAIAGIASPVHAERLELRRPVLYGEIYFNELKAARRPIAYDQPDLYPESHFEISVLLDEHGSTNAPIAIIDNLKIKEIQKARLLTIYTGAPLPEGKKSVSYEVICHSAERTLDKEALQQFLDLIVAELKKNGYPLRG